MPADLPPPPPALERFVLHDARAIDDCAAFRYADLAPEPRNRWVIAVLEPAPDSGAAAIPGAKLQGGKLHVPAGAQTVVQKKGKWKRQAAQGTDWAAEGEYAWQEPLNAPARGVKPEDVYSAFASGGVIFFRPAPDAPAGIARFGRVQLLVREWAGFVPQAAGYIQKQAGAPGALPDATALQRMIGSENPVLALLGFRETVAQRDLTPTEVGAAIDRTRGALRATFIAVLLLKPRAALEDPALGEAAERATNRELLAPFASAALAVVLLHPTDAAAAARAKALLARVRLRAGQLGGPLASDESLALSYRLAGLAP